MNPAVLVACGLIAFVVMSAQATTDPGKCLPLEAPPNGDMQDIVNRNNIGDVVAFRCNSGFDLKGSEKRRCQRDGTWSGEPPKCVDIDECKSKELNKCAQLCKNTEGSYQCSCRPGYQLLSDKRTCKDIDECKSKELNKCSQLCKNTEGSYQCSCRPGYQLLSDKRTCKDMDECSLKINDCTQLCTNTPGSYQCSCRPGYQLQSNKRTCKGVECQAGKGLSYRGNVAVTKSGGTCQAWADQTPHKHSNTPWKRAIYGLKGNFCRNPDRNVDGVWCYTTSSGKRWEYCDVPVCA